MANVFVILLFCLYIYKIFLLLSIYIFFTIKKTTNTGKYLKIISLKYQLLESIFAIKKSFYFNTLTPNLCIPIYKKNRHVNTLLKN